MRESVGLADVSWVVKLDVKGTRATSQPGGSAAWWRLGASHYLVTCDPAERESVLAGIDAASSTDVTSVWAALLLAGPMSRQVLRKLTSLNVSDAALPDGGCGQASLAHVHAIVLRRDLRDVSAFLLLVSREYAESVQEALLHAGREFQIAPFGLEALQGLRF